MTHLRKAMLEELQRRNLSPITTRIYLRAVEEFARYYNKPPDRLGPKHIRQYQAHLFTDRKLDAISVAQQLSALRFFFLKTLKRPWIVEDLPTPKKPIRLPQILSREEVERRWKLTTSQWPIMNAVLHGVNRNQLMARHKSNHLQVAYGKDAASADLALAAKAVAFHELGIEVYVCGCESGKGD